jgi:hypothetical protein
MEYWELEWGYTNVHTQNKKGTTVSIAIHMWMNGKKPEKAYS